MIVGLKGYAGVGKDAIADILEPQGFQKLSFAEALRKGLYALNPIIDTDDGGVSWVRYVDLIDSIGYVRAKSEYPEIRELLQRLGTELGRNILGENVWVDAAFKDVIHEEDYICTDMRFPNEYFAVRERGGICVQVLRPGVGPVNDHPSETSIDHMHYDYTIDNDGTLEELTVKVQEMIDWVWDSGLLKPISSLDTDFTIMGVYE